MKKSCEYWLGDEGGFLTHVAVEKKVHDTPTKDLQSMSLSADHDALSGADEFGEFGYMVSRADNLAIVNVSGSLTVRDRSYNRYMGMVSYNEIRNAVFSALDSDVDGIVLNMDTPGGSASGVSELAEFLAEVDASMKPIYTYSGTTMASGGYWLGSMGREIYAGKLATVGSIGVITVHSSYEKMFKAEGVEHTVLRAGEFKALGSPYEKLDDKARSQIESQMNAIYDVFLETVADNRGTTVPALRANAAEGRVFVGTQAIEVGLVDHISSFDVAVSEISRKVRSSNSIPLVKHQSEINTGTDMTKKRVLTEAAIAAVAEGASEAEIVKDPKMTIEVDDVPAADVSADAGSEGNLESGEPAADAGSDEGAGKVTSASDESGMVNTLFNKVGTLTEELAISKANLVGVTAKLETAESTEDSLKKMVAISINKMQVAMGGAPLKLNDVEASVIIEQHNRTHSAFNQKYKVGASAHVPESDDFEANTKNSGTNSVVEAAQARLTDKKIK